MNCFVLQIYEHWVYFVLFYNLILSSRHCVSNNERWAATGYRDLQIYQDLTLQCYNNISQHLARDNVNLEFNS